MEAGETEARGQTREARGCWGGEASSCCGLGSASRLIEGLELSQLVQVGGGPRGRDGPHQRGRGR